MPHLNRLFKTCSIAILSIVAIVCLPSFFLQYYAWDSVGTLFSSKGEYWFFILLFSFALSLPTVVIIAFQEKGNNIN